MRLSALFTFAALVSLAGNASASLLTPAPRTLLTSQVCAKINVKIKVKGLLGNALKLKVLDDTCMCISAGVLTQDSLLTLNVKASESALVTGDGLESILGPLFEAISLYTKDELAALVKLAAVPQLQGTPNSCAYPAGAIPTGCGTCDYKCPANQYVCNNKCVDKSVACQSNIPRRRDQLALGGGKWCRGKQQLCLIAGASGKSRNDFECIDTATDLESCGGCVESAESYPTPIGTDCSAIPGVQNVSCELGRCVVTSCLHSLSSPSTAAACRGKRDRPSRGRLCTIIVTPLRMSGRAQPPQPPPAPAPIRVDSNRWEAELEKAEISKADLNALIIDYLVIEGFSDAAIELARETGLPVHVDQASIQERMEIREAVEEGRVEEAVRRVNELDPEILDNNPPLLFHLHLLRLIELIRLDQVDAALDFATRELAPRGAQNPEFLQDLEKTMALLAFPDIAKFADDASDAPAPAPSPETMSLLQDPAFAPIVQLMRRTQRIKVAKELNSAILENGGQGTETKLSGLVRLMAWAEEKLEKSGVTLPEGEKDRGRRWADDILRGEL